MWIRPPAAEPRLPRTATHLHRAARGARRGTALGLALSLLLHAPAPFAQTAAAVEGEQLIATVRVNTLTRGDVVVLRRPDGDWWVGEADLKNLNLAPDPAARRAYGGEAFYSLRALGAATLLFNEPTLTLAVEFPAQALGETHIDLSARPPPPPPAARQTSLVMSYRLSMQPALQGQAARTALATDTNVRIGPVLLRQEMRIDSGALQRHVLRGQTQAIWDDPQRGTRLIAGDLVSSGGAFGGTITGAGVLYQRLFDLQPGLIKQPTATLRASTALPAEVEVSVDGTPLYRGRVPPGPLVMDNLLLYGGTRNVRVTITDASGRREVIEQPFMFTDAVLAKGLHEFSYFAGKRSGIGADGQIRYGEPAWQGFHRYGATDHVTIAAGGEGNRDFTNAGVGAAVRADGVGLVAGEVLASQDHERHTRSLGWAGRYTYQLPESSLAVSRRRFAAGFRSFATSALSPFLRDETQLVAATRLFRGTISLELLRSEDALERRRTGALRYATGFANGVTLTTELQRTRTAAQNDWSLNVYLRVDLDGNRWAEGRLRHGNGLRELTAEAGQQAPTGEGLGWRVGTTQLEQAGVRSSEARGALQWNLRPVTLEAYTTTALNGGSQYAEFAASGALVAVDGFVGLTRQVNEGFVLARLGVPQEGIEVFLNNQSQGRTDGQGQLFIPGVGPFGSQDVTIDEKSLGMQYSLTARRQVFALPYRGGMVVDFGGQRLRAVAGMAWAGVGAGRTPIASRVFTLSGDAGKLVVETTRAGDFYLDNAPPGRYTGALERGGKTYACRMDVPDSAEAVLELKEGIVCE
ncbi:fimbria/pilus outer membrane usher protein [Ramlibacter humi]|uniref:Fimbrial biogenesis outer membrane usher protein n=1 Tax=Ramlibacter humi TaxID=2530451 RepID=A0A4Z0CAZ9_9BURK|nr:fimbria/pilus outer membrane usher protein [Ramlibacter humi]TFZ08511.1 fimbrial biogenesis outer membrane usher protein [Ramlibacter humi]